MIAGAATFVASAQSSFEKTYRFSINYSSNEVTITGVREGVKLQGDIQIPGSYTSTRDGVKYTVTSLRGDIENAEFGMPRPVFENQDEITSIYIPSTIDDIVVDSFRGCKRLKEFKVSSQSKTFKAVDGVLYYLRGEDSVDMMRFPPARTSTGFTLPDEAGYILEGAFADNYTITTLRLSKWQLLETGALDGNLGITRFELNGHYLYESTFEGTSLETVNTRKVNEVDMYGFATDATLRKVVIPAHDGTMTLGYKAFVLAPSAEIYIDHKSMTAAMTWDDWHDMFEYPSDALPKIYTSKRSFGRFFTKFDELYVPAGSRSHYMGLCAAGSACRDRIYEMFSYSAVNPSQEKIAVTPLFNWVKITSVTINGTDAVLSDGVWSKPGAVSVSSTMNVVIGYTANNIKMSTEYNFQVSTGIEDTEACEANIPRHPRTVIYRHASAQEGAVYYDMQGRRVIAPREGGIYITF